jgi:hypothetical protein
MPKPQPLPQPLHHPTRHTAPVLPLPIADPDIVDRMFELLAEDPALQKMDPQVLAQVKAQLRREFRGEVRQTSPQDRADPVHKVLSLFNGRNATEIARHLRISRASVYRYIKQAGTARQAGASLYRVPAQNRLSFPGTETPPALPCTEQPPAPIAAEPSVPCPSPALTSPT